MSKTVWQIIEESKAGNKYLKSKKQYKNLYNILSKLPQEEVDVLKNNWMDLSNKMTRSEEFQKLHSDLDGIICGGDDGFYMDFGSWVMAQGEELYNNFIKNGHQVIIEYIKENKVSESDYMFECMEYAFLDFLSN